MRRMGRQYRLGLLSLIRSPWLRYRVFGMATAPIEQREFVLMAPGLVTHGIQNARRVRLSFTPSQKSDLGGGSGYHVAHESSG